MTNDLIEMMAAIECEAERLRIPDLFPRVCERVLQFPGPVVNPRAFIIRVKRNIICDQIRRRSVERDQASRSQSYFPGIARSGALEVLVDETPDKLAQQHECIECVRYAMARLPNSIRQIVHLRIWKNLTYKQIATVTGVSERTVKRRAKEGLDLLKPFLQPLREIN